MVKLAVHLQLPESKAEKLPKVIVCHGLGGNQNEPLISEIASDVLKERMGVVRSDFNGQGKSGGNFYGIKSDPWNMPEYLPFGGYRKLDKKLLDHHARPVHLSDGP